MLIRINDARDARLDPYRDLPKPRVARRHAWFVVESRLVVQRLLDSDFDVCSILCHEAAALQLTGVVKERPEIPIYVLDRLMLAELIGFKFHRGVLALARRPANRQLEDQVQRDVPTPQVLVVCPHVTDPVNLAGILRSSMAFGVNGLIVGRESTDVFSRRVVRGSMGGVFGLPIRVSDNIPADLDRLGSEFGFHRVATVLDSSADLLPRQQSPARLALVFGSEGPGLDHTTRNRCDQLVTLPMELCTDSLNLATAASVFLYHYRFVGSIP